MKKPIKIAVLLSLIMLISACSSTNRMTIGVTEPARIFLSSEIRNIGIINRSEPAKRNAGLDRIDQLLSAEGFNLDKKGADAAISAFSSQAKMIKNFDEIIVIEPTEAVKSGLGVLPATLSWEIIEQLCEENNVDLIFSLAFYDTDIQSAFRVTSMPFENNLGIKVNLPAQEVTLNTVVNSGWRIYDPQTRLVLDEHIYTKNMIFSGRGINPMKAIEAIKQRNETIQEYSSNVGIAYANRLVPNNLRISRDYFVRGSNNFKIAQRRAQTGNWKGAAELWTEELKNTNLKIRGRANYNMAISSEIDGDLDLAIEYASKAYADYRNRLALDYVNILKYRVEQNIRLEEQLSN